MQCNKKATLYHHIVKLTLGYILLSPECYTSLASISSSYKDLCCIKIAHLRWQLVLKGCRLLQETVLSDLVKIMLPHEGLVLPRRFKQGYWGQIGSYNEAYETCPWDRQVSYQLCSLCGLIKPFNFPFASGVVCYLFSL